MKKIVYTAILLTGLCAFVILPCSAGQDRAPFAAGGQPETVPANQTSVSAPVSKEAIPRFHYPATESFQAPSTPLRPPRTARLVFAGDVMQHLPQIAAARQPDGTFDYGRSFACIAPLFREAELAVVNLETTLTAAPPYTGYPCFRSPAALAAALRQAGVGACMLANNHCCDGGVQGIWTTIALLDQQGIAHTGVFADSADYRRNHPLLLRAGELNIALLNYTYGTNGIPIPPGTIVNRIDTAAMARDLAAVRSRCDLVAVCIHWGEEYARYENAAQRRLALFLKKHGADLVIGSHPHVVQPYETTPESAVFYSLGNFVSNQRRRYCDGGLTALIDACLRPGLAPQLTVRALPVWVLLPDYRILPPEAADTVVLSDDERAQYKLFLRDTRNLLSGTAHQ